MLLTGVMCAIMEMPAERWMNTTHAMSVEANRVRRADRRFGIKHYQNNPRKITDQQLNKLKASLDEFGDLGCIVHEIQTDQIISANQRVKAMNLYGATPKITQTFDPPTPQGTVALGYIEHAGERFAYRAVRWTAEQCQRVNIVANAAGGSWDWNILASEFPAELLVSSGLDADALAAMQTDADALGKMLAVEPVAETADAGELASKADELQAKWGTATGQIWQLGEHRLIIGDCTDKATVDALMQGERAQAVVTDPPYGISIVGKNRTAGNFPGTNAPRLKADPIQGDDKPFDPAHLLMLADKIVLWGANHYADKLPASSKWLIWDKKDGAFVGSDLGDCELAWTNQDGAARLLHHTWQGMYRKGVGERDARLHPTQKPVALMEWCFEQIGIGKDVVIDPYAGSGTTLIACENTKRKCRAIEISPVYSAVTLERWSILTGKMCERVAA